MKTIVLTGMSGSGKTTVGKILSMMTGSKFLDIDLEIEKSENKKINEIFALYGENYFRNLEEKMLKDLFEPENLILSLGGGTFQNKNTRDLLLNSANVFYLKTSPETILSRLKNCNDRPLLNNNMTFERINNLLAERTKNYELAHFTVETDNKSTDMVSKEILKCVSL